MLLPEFVEDLKAIQESEADLLKNEQLISTKSEEIKGRLQAK